MGGEFGFLFRTLSDACEIECTWPQLPFRSGNIRTPQPLPPVLPSLKIELRLDDCITGMAGLPAGSIDMGVTSPPFNFGTAYSTYDDSGDRSAYLKWTRQRVSEVKRVLRDDGSLFLNIGATPSNPYLPHEIILEVRDLFALQNTIHWVKSISVETRDGEIVSAGHFKPINSRRFVTDSP